MNFAGVKAITIPEGDVKSIAIGGVTVWQKPSQIPYVADGLVAWWDGIWNAGLGVHDAAATAWKDLVGERDFTGITSFTATALELNPSAMTAAASWIIPYTDVSCMEAVLIVSESFGNKTLCNMATGYAYSWATVGKRGIFLREEDGGCIKLDSLATTKNRSYALTGYTVGKVVSISQNFSGADSVVNGFRVNGVVTTTTNDSAAGVGSYHTARINAGSGLIYCIRLYNRALTAAEVAANYAVDKERFGLS